MQLFVRTVTRTICLQAETLEDVKLAIEDGDGIPISEQRLLYAGRVLPPSGPLSSSRVAPGATLDLLLPLMGGKGGFGNLLRHVHGQSKVTNFDACRDLSGRRIRYIEAEKKVKDWEGEKKERDLEKEALAHIKRSEKESRVREVDERVKEAVVDELREAVVKAEASARAGYQRALGLEEEKKKRKREEQKKQAEAAKRMRLVGLDEDPSDLSDTDSDSEEEAPAAKTVKAPAREPAAKGGAAVASSSGAAASAAAAAAAPAPQAAATPSAPSGTDGPKSPSKSAAAASAAPTSPPSQPHADPHPPHKAFDIHDFIPVDLEVFDHVADLEDLGLDHLKAELMRRGMKCGGTLRERAARLFAVKGKPQGKAK